MTQIRLDADQAIKLQGAGESLPTLIPSGWEPISPDISPEELQRRINVREKRYTTQEMLSLLETS